mmetsp:Transcript_4833/g.7291  ORF Transcript_4833/g.7291 Transcript_4833/m.7291 type:complete len:241 (+) Transcript_4833:56-778(+)
MQHGGSPRFSDQFDASEYMKQSWQQTDSQQFPTALDDVNHAIRLLLQEPEKNRLLIKFCALYKLSLKIHIQIRLLVESSDAHRVAQLATVLAEVPTLPLHRVQPIRSAIDKCTKAELYDVAQRLIKLLLTRRPANASELRSLQANIKKKRRQDPNDESSSSLSCDAPPLSEAERFMNKNPVLAYRVPICYQSLQLLSPSGSHLQCSFCHTSFSEKEKKIGESCPSCNYATLQQLNPSSDT